MGYLSCRADSSVATCRAVGISSASPLLSSSPAIQRFSYAVLDAATSHFADAALLGRGSHGAVYKAFLPSGRTVAVKRPSSPLHREVDNEIRILSILRSPHLVNLLGYSCPSDGDLNRPRLLVVEYMPNGTLYELFHFNPRPPGWARRVRLALQIAKALHALHAADPPVIHRDVKSANILLDANHEARLADFGLALRAPTKTPGAEPSARATSPPRAAGTLGYLDPAYVTPESLSTKSDVFSFGILLLEIMSGRKAMDVAYSPPSVVEWAVPLLRKGKVAALFDPRVLPPRDPAVRHDLAALAASCVRSSKDRRPSMADIVERLKVLSNMVSEKAWNELAVVGNPCATVDVEKTVSKRGANGIAVSEHGSSSMLPFDDDGEVVDVHTDALDDEASKKPRATTRERRNLLELMAQIDGVAGQRFDIRRVRTVHATSVHIEKDAALLPRRNQTVRVVVSKTISEAEGFGHLDVNIRHKAEKGQAKAVKNKDKAGEG